MMNACFASFPNTPSVSTWDNPRNQRPQSRDHHGPITLIMFHAVDAYALVGKEMIGKKNPTYRIEFSFLRIHSKQDDNCT